METGDLFARAGDYVQALATYLEAWNAIEEDPASRMEVVPPRALALGRRIADCHEHLGRYAEGIGMLEPLVASVPDPDLLTEEDRLELGRCHFFLGKCYLGAGRMEEAQAAARLAEADLRDGSSPEHGFVHNLLGGISFRRGEMDQAREHYKAALEHFRSHGDVINLATGYINLGNLHKQRCEWERALEHYQAAYYLRATEGEFQGQGGILQNLGLVLMKVGRYHEAQERLEDGLSRALTLGDPVRALRSRLGLARLARESLDLETARDHLRFCQSGAPDPLPEREGCLLLLEEAHLQRIEQRWEDSRATCALVRERVRKLASRGDLMVEADLLGGVLEHQAGRWDSADEHFHRALSLAQEDRDREQENRALHGLLEVAVSTSRIEEADRLCRLLEERHGRGGEQPALARLHVLRGKLEQGPKGEPELALASYGRARELWRRMGRHRWEAIADLLLADTLLDLGRSSEAAAILQAQRERLDPEDLALPPIQQLLLHLQERAERLEEVHGPARLDGERAFRRLEEILSCNQDRSEKVREVLILMTEALGADGAVLARTDGSLLEVVSTASMGRLQGRRSFPLRTLGLRDASRATVLEPPPDEREAGIGSAMALPCLLAGREHLLYLERRSAIHPTYRRSDLDYAMVLLAEAARVLRPIPPGEEPTRERVPAEMARIRRGIHLADVVTQNARMLSILELIRKVGESDLTILLQGETGTGKKLLAQAIHRTSRRQEKPFVTVDCAALPDSLLESELFGHRKGAFTGAVSDRIGLLEEANGGTIFLDEIDKAGLTVQRRFLHMLDSGEVRPVGATGYRRLDVRVVCATSCPDLRHEVEAGRFLKDLYYRLNDISIVVPPLRERPDDVPLLAEWFIEKFAREQDREIAGVTPAFHEALAVHSWPGNVRELEKAIRRAVTLVDAGAHLIPDLLPAAVLESAGPSVQGTAGTLREKLEAYERGLLLEVLDRTRWNKSRAAVELGLSRRGLKNKIQRYRLDRRRTRRP